MLLFSPLIAWCLVKPEELEPEVVESGATVLELTLALVVSITRPLFGDLFLRISSSTQSAGVGGTGPSEEAILAPGLLVGGDFV